jgi:hypothetical protein
MVGAMTRRFGGWMWLAALATLAVASPVASQVMPASVSLLREPDSATVFGRAVPVAAADSTAPAVGSDEGDVEDPALLVPPLPDDLPRVDARLLPSGGIASASDDGSDSASVVPHVHHTTRNVLLFLSGSAATIGVLWALPDNTSKWSKRDHGWHHFLEAYQSPPTWDTDPWGWNYVAHPVFGAITYLMERDFDESPMRSFLFSAWASTTWEFVIEAAMEHPSTQDLIVTPVAGSLLGEGIYQVTKMMRHDGFSTVEKVVVTIINPVYVFQRGYH